eukprot:14940-Heterococcus_DN1.PRE.2
MMQENCKRQTDTIAPTGAAVEVALCTRISNAFCCDCCYDIDATHCDYALQPPARVLLCA